MSESNLAVFLSKIEVSESGCWDWRGAKFVDGYGNHSFQVNNVKITRAAHRWAYWKWKGEIPAGMEIHHKCRNRACVNPDHLELLTREDHRKLHPSKLQDVCKRGHSMADSYVDKTGKRIGRRCCRVCMLESVRRWQEKNKERVLTMQREYRLRRALQ